MPWHSVLIGLATLEKPQADMASPSKFATAAAKIPNVVEAFRVAGRFDAVVIIHGDTYEEKLEAFRRVQALANVARVVALTSYPHPDHHAAAATTRAP